jgi:DNA repair exonuclease SbcCD ATPase subunit
MKKALALCLFAWTLLACDGKLGSAPGGGSATRSVDNVDQIKTENQDLRNRNTQLEMVNEQQSQMLAEYTEKLNQILDSLDAINGKQNEIDRLMNNGAEGGFVSTRYDIDTRIRANLAEIDERLRTSRMYQGEIRRLADRSGGRAAGIVASVDRLNRLLIDKEREIQDLRRRVAELETTSQVLRQEVARKQTVIEEREQQIGRLQSELREAFYILGTSAELRALVKEGVLERQRSGFIQSLYRAGGDSHRYRFRRMDPTADRVSLGPGLRGAEIVSLHQSYQNLYRFERQEDETILVITDPYQFWDISKYLVIQVER